MINDVESIVYLAELLWMFMSQYRLHMNLQYRYSHQHTTYASPIRYNSSFYTYQSRRYQ